MKMKVTKGSRVLIKYLNHPQRIKEGKVLDSQGNCIYVQTLAWRFGFLKAWRKEWFAFDSRDYTLIVEQEP